MALPSLPVGKSYAEVTSIPDSSPSSPARNGVLRVTIRVRPGSRHESVGGRVGGAIVVRVRARAVDQAATRAALTLLADAFGVRASAVHLERGATSRDKVIAIAGDVELLARRRDALAGEAG